MAGASADPLIVPGRECGTCALCCKVYRIDAFDKPQGRWCPKCVPGRGCKIHPNRPQECREFYCLWLTEKEMTPEWKPEHAKIVFSIFPENNFVYGQVDPGFPHAWRKEPYFSELLRWSAVLMKEKRQLLIFINNIATLIMPTGPVPLGPMSPKDSFVLHTVFTESGPSYVAERVPSKTS